jgi:hypothetical protein
MIVMHPKIFAELFLPHSRHKRTGSRAAARRDRLCDQGASIVAAD